MKMNTVQTLRINRLAPATSLVLLVVVTLVFAGPKSYTPEIKRHHEVISGILDEFPYKLGTWVGIDVALPSAATAILRPNGYVNRRYSQIGQPNSVVLGIIHCEDVRDMDGHFPPRCYPAAGWSQVGEEDIKISLQSQTEYMKLYQFERATQAGLEERKSVVSAFIAPDAGLLTSMESLQKIGSSSLNSSKLGVAQLQLVYSDNLDIPTIREHANDILSHFPNRLIEKLMTNPMTPSAAAIATLNLEDDTNE